ncbi:hypothetical protein MFLO_01095 [Listeria floridensis FSL S10-1187]|uniref:Uncharacterized protein n=1 Tax=Listeria floridensis FSL S10-1187 TaxID=1265817 RepID=A0ABN0RII6_9LIST|nr:hypothetical protein [Listeria floridensis]EUJ33785.1 hypothetical protein MFLO_01095 [Listeria floridensis FSL S10-1187]
MSDTQEFLTIQNEQYVTLVEFDWEEAEHAVDTVRKMVANDVATIILGHSKKMEAYLNEMNIPFERYRGELFIERPTLYHAELLITEYCEYHGDKYMVLFLFKECEFKLDQVVFRKKPEWNIGYYLQEDAIALTLVKNQSDLFISARSEREADAFVEVMDKRLDGERVSVIDRIGAAPERMEVSDAYLADHSLPLSDHFVSVSGRALATPPFLKRSDEGEKIDRIFEEPLVMVVVSSDHEDEFDDLEIEYRTDSKMVISAPIEQELRTELFEKLHKASLIDPVYLFYVEEPELEFVKQQGTTFFSKIFTPAAKVDFRLKSGAKCIVLSLDGEMAILYEN